MSKPDLARLRRAATTAAVLHPDGRILLHQRSDNGKWALPGGAIEIGESADEAIVREVREETGYEVEVVRLVGIYSGPAMTTISYPNGDIAAYVSLLFECRVLAGEPTLCDETMALGWFHSGELPEPFLASHLERVGDAFERREAAFIR